MRQWFTMKAAKDGKSAEILIYDEIGKSWWDENTVTAKKFDEDLKALGDVTNITLRVNSPGGNVFDGVAIHNTLKNHPANVTAHVDGIAASIASYIVMAADKIVMPKNAFMLVHGASGFAWGNAKTMRATADDLDRIDTSMTATYANKSGKKPAEIQAIMDEDRLMDATEAHDLGLCDELVEEVKMAANYSMRLLPQAAAEKLKPLFTAEEKKEEPVDPPVKTDPEDPAPPVKEPESNVVALDNARKQARGEVVAYVKAVHELCALAKLPGEAKAFIDADTSLDGVRATLITKRASADEVELNAQHVATSQQSPKAAWGKITDKMNARVK